MGILSWIVVGAIAGWLAGLGMKGRGFGVLGEIILVIGGGLIGGWLAGELLNLQAAVNGNSPIGILVAFLGVIGLIAVLRLSKGRGRRSLLDR